MRGRWVVLLLMAIAGAGSATAYLEADPRWRVVGVVVDVGCAAVLAFGHGLVRGRRGGFEDGRTWGYVDGWQAAQVKGNVRVTEGGKANGA